MSGGDFAAWIDEGEKYAIVGLSVKTEGQIASRQVGSDLYVLAGQRFAIPEDWRAWLGSVRIGEVEDCNLFLLSKMPSSTPDLLDDENKTLQQLVWNFYVGLLLASRFAAAHRPVMLTGARRNGEIGIRQQSDIDAPVPCIFRPYPALLRSDIQLAAEIAAKLGALPKAPPPGGLWRFNRALHIYTEARTIADILDRLHQYCRCIDGLILPGAGETRRQFKSRTELFIGPRHHNLMGEIYDVRSAVGHLHESRYLKGFDRATRLDLMKKEAIAERIARGALARVLTDKSLWPHFANTPALAAFWALPVSDRQGIWGAPFDPMDALADVDPQYIYPRWTSGSSVNSDAWRQERARTRTGDVG